MKPAACRCTHQPSRHRPLCAGDCPCRAYLPGSAVTICNYCRKNPPEPGQVVCRACMDRIPPWEAT